MKTTLLILVALALSGCANLPKKFAEMEKLGVVSAQITGKFSNTEYQVVKENGKRRAVLTHSNPWIVKAVVVRETEEK